MTEKEKNQKNKEGIANVLTVIGGSMVLISIIVAFMFGPEVFGTLFFVSLIGTVLIFVSNYIRNGYLKFFN